MITITIRYGKHRRTLQIDKRAVMLDLGAPKKVIETMLKSRMTSKTPNELQMLIMWAHAWSIGGYKSNKIDVTFSEPLSYFTKDQVAERIDGNTKFWDGFRSLLKERLS